MIPSLWVPLQQIPLTSNGKVDRNALPGTDMHLSITHQYVMPRTTLEHTLVNIWQDLLGVEKIGIRDNFFELGGDSIITIQVVSRARQQGYVFKVADIFTHQNIEKLAAVIELSKDGLSPVSAEQQVLNGPSGLLPIQQRYFSRQHEVVNHFNQTVLLKIEKD